MKHVLAFALVSLVVLSVTAAEREGRRWRNRGDRFEQLFNGTNLHGWKGDPALWSVENGNMVGRTTAGQPLKENSCLIWSEGTVYDFELRLDYKITGNNPRGIANSGIQYRSREITNSSSRFTVGGYRANIEASGLQTGILYEEGGRGILAECGQMTRVSQMGTVNVIGSLGTPADIQSVIRRDDWNEYVILARGHQLTHLINGRVTVQVTDAQEGLRALTGILALRLHTGEPMTVQFRNIRLKTL